jgi:hypothetical protein
VIGTDLSLVQPRYVPANLQFEQSDAEDPEAWIFPQKFDYVHGRALASCFKDPLEVIKSAYSVCAHPLLFNVSGMGDHYCLG